MHVFFLQSCSDRPVWSLTSIWAVLTPGGGTGSKRGTAAVTNFYNYKLIIQDSLWGPSHVTVGHIESTQPMICISITPA